MVGIKKSFVPGGENIASGSARGKPKGPMEGMASGARTASSFGKKAKPPIPRAKPKAFASAVGGPKTSKNKLSTKPVSPFNPHGGKTIGGHSLGKRGG